MTCTHCMHCVDYIFTCFSVNLMTCIISLATIARQRPSYISTVLQAFELLHGIYMATWLTYSTSIWSSFYSKSSPSFRHFSNLKCTKTTEGIVMVLCSNTLMKYYLSFFPRLKLLIYYDNLPHVSTIILIT